MTTTAVMTAMATSVDDDDDDRGDNDYDGNGNDVLRPTMLLVNVPTMIMIMATAAMMRVVIKCFA